MGSWLRPQETSRWSNRETGSYGTRTCSHGRIKKSNVWASDVKWWIHGWNWKALEKNRNTTKFKWHVWVKVVTRKT